MKRANSKMKIIIPLLVMLFIGFVLIAEQGFEFDNLFVMPAEAVVGRPATPGSVAGMARRTSRRTSRRVSRRHAIAYGTRVTVLPPAYTTTVVAGVTYYVCIWHKGDCASPRLHNDGGRRRNLLCVRWRVLPASL
jgi:hypothetical protein